MGDLDNEATRIFQNSMTSNSWRVYKFAFNRFSKFIKYSSCLSLAGFPVSTINCYGASSYRTVLLGFTYGTVEGQERNIFILGFTHDRHRRNPLYNL